MMWLLKASSFVNCVNLASTPLMTVAKCSKESILCGVAKFAKYLSSTDENILTLLENIQEEILDVLLFLEASLLKTDIGVFLLQSGVGAFLLHSGALVVVVDLAKYISFALGCVIVDNACRRMGLIGGARKLTEHGEHDDENTPGVKGHHTSVTGETVGEKPCSLSDILGEGTINTSTSWNYITTWDDLVKEKRESEQRSLETPCNRGDTLDSESARQDTRTMSLSDRPSSGSEPEAGLDFEQGTESPNGGEGSSLVECREHESLGREQEESLTPEQCDIVPSENTCKNDLSTVQTQSNNEDGPPSTSSQTSHCQSYQLSSASNMSYSSQEETFRRLTTHLENPSDTTGEVFDASSYVLSSRSLSPASVQEQQYDDRGISEPSDGQGAESLQKDSFPNSYSDSLHSEEHLSENVDVKREPTADDSQTHNASTSSGFRIDVPKNPIDDNDVSNSMQLVVDTGGNTRTAILSLSSFNSDQESSETEPILRAEELPEESLVSMVTTAETDGHGEQPRNVQNKAWQVYIVQMVCWVLFGRRWKRYFSRSYNF